MKKYAVAGLVLSIAFVMGLTAYSAASSEALALFVEKEGVYQVKPYQEEYNTKEYEKYESKEVEVKTIEVKPEYEKTYERETSAHVYSAEKAVLSNATVKRAAWPSMVVEVHGLPFTVKVTDQTEVKGVSTVAAGDRVDVRGSVSGGEIHATYFKNYSQTDERINQLRQQIQQLLQQVEQLQLQLKSIKY